MTVNQSDVLDLDGERLRYEHVVNERNERVVNAKNQNAVKDFKRYYEKLKQEAETEAYLRAKWGDQYEREVDTPHATPYVANVLTPAEQADVLDLEAHRDK